MRRLADLRETVSTWRKVEKDAASFDEMLELAEGDKSFQVNLEQEGARFADALNKLEVEVAFQGPFDNRSAIVSFHAGAGGTESQDWAEMLMRMILRWAERRGFQTTILDLNAGEEAGIKSAQIEVKGKYAYGYLKSEKGTHRLVRLSPFDADHARHTSFALVEVMPEAEGDVDVKVNPNDLRIDIFHSGGKGGQNVQKVATAVRIVHIPTGTTVSVQNERSQRQNKEAAMTILMSRLMHLELAKRAEEQAQIKGEYVPAEFGNRIRSYVLHPYKQVKDHRTDYETSNAEAVLDGDLDGFMTAYLRSRIGAS